MTYLRKNRHLQLITLTAFLFLAVVAPMLYVFTMRPKTAQAAWFDDVYSYRHKLTFTHNADISADRSVTLTLDTLELTNANVLQNDCDDVRFTDANGKILSHDMTGSCNSATNTFEVIFSSIVNGSNLFYVYYGNPTAPNAEINSTGYTALTPSGGDPSETDPTTDGNQEQGPGPISYWGFDEAQGSTANDYSSGSDNDLTITNAAWKTSDLCVFGNCMYFDGSTDYATKSYSADTELLPSTGSFTVTSWFKHTSTAGADTAISRVDAVAGIGWKVYMDSSGFLCFGIDAVAGTFPNDSACSTTSYADSRWHFITAVKSGTTSITLFVDGSQVKQTTGITGTTLDGTNAPLIIGNDFDGGTNGWDGFIDEVKYYNFAKTTPQIIAEYASKSTAKGTAASFGTNQAGAAVSNGLIAWWKLDESSGNPADSSGNGLTLTNNGVTTFAAGKFVKASSHNGTTQYFSTATTISSIQTVAFWVNPASTTDDYINLITSTAYINSSSGTISATGFTSPSIYVNGALNGAITASVWNHVVVTTATAVSATAFEAGRANGVYLDNTGKMDDVRVYNRALQPSEVATLYNWAPGPVGWWKMEDGVGTTANDSSGNGYSMSLLGTTSWQTGKYGNAVDFNNPAYQQTDRLYRADTDAFDFGSGSFTIEGWIYRKYRTQGDVPHTLFSKFWCSTCSQGGYIFGLDAPNGGTNVQLQLDDDVSPATSANDVTVTGSTSTPQDTWIHIAGVVDRATQTATVYLNGVLEGSASINSLGSITTTNEINIGAFGGGYAPAHSKVDDVRVYNYARTPKQIVEDMNAGHPAGGSPVGSQAVYWNFDEGQGTTANNSGTASSSNGTLTSIASPATSSSGWTFTGKVNKGIIFDGTDDNVVIATANDGAVDFATTESFSASAWVYVTTMPGSGNQDAIIAKWDETGNLAAYKLYVENDDADTTGNFEVQIYDESASQAIIASQVIDQVAVNTWYHVAFTFNGGVAGAAGDLKLYVNGNLTAQNAANASFLGLEDLASDFTVGDYDAGDAVANNTAFTGTIDEVKVYSGLLTQSEILVDMNAGSSAALGGVLGTQDNEGFGGNPPVGWWKMDEGTANTCTGGTNDACDSSGGGYDGSWNGNAVNTVGRIGNAVAFDGVDDYVNIGTSFPGLGETFTISGWAYFNSFDGFPEIIAKHQWTNLDYRIVKSSSNNSLTGEISYTGVESTGPGAESPINLTTGQWHHFALTKSSTQLTMFLDGVAGTPTSTSGTVNNNTSLELRFGIRQDGSQELNGRIDDVRIYNYALTSAQVAYIYNRGAPVGHWEFDECQGSTAYNAALNANNEAAGMNGTITIGATGSNTSLGTCNSGTTTEAWNNGTTGKFNAGIDFDGTDDYSYTADNSTLDFAASEDFTLSAWIKSSQGQVVGKFFTISAKWATSGYGISLHNSTTDARWYCEINDPTSYVQYGRSDIADGSWHHVVCIRSGTTLSTYQDGKLANSGSATSGSLANTAVFLIGGDVTATFFPGQIDDVRIYRYALTTAQIQRLYNEGFAQRFGPVTGSP